jgi:ectoine hydroxylase-related dioxygenase (phytanoyl-CoA dioxygenase family)
MTPRYSEDPLLELSFDDTETVPVSAGEAVVFDMALAHGSDMNHSNLPRYAAAVAYAPKSARLSLYFCDTDDSVEELAVPHPDVFRQIDWRVRPDYLESLGMISSDRPPTSSAEFLQQSRAISQGSATY